MTKHEAITPPEIDLKKTGLDLMRVPFEPHQISKLPKPTKKQTDEVRQDFKKGIRCQVCGGWHHKDVVHLDYVGHAALTDRLLECDPGWNWEPVSFDERGQPLMDPNGGMWIKLTVCGQTRLGYGHADGKRGGDAVKEIIGDALRNAAMRFGAALDLWHKGDLHGIEGPTEGDEAAGKKKDEAHGQQQRQQVSQPQRVCDQMITGIRRHGAISVEQDPSFAPALAQLRKDAPELAAHVDAEIETWKQANKPAPSSLIGDDEIPY